MRIKSLMITEFLRPLIATLIIGAMLSTSVAQVSAVKFGKNRVQYHDDFSAYWTYDTDHFTIHWYGKAKNIAQTAIQMAEMDISEIQNLLEHRIDDRIKIVVYTDLSDLKQSNFGSEDAFTLKDEKTKVIGNVVLVYFNGEHTQLRKQIRRGITEIFINSMLYGANLQEILQNALSFQLPKWFTKGLVSFVGESWNADIDEQMHLALMGKDAVSNFDELSIKDPLLAGHSMWNFLAKTYGRSSIASLLYLTKINRNFETAFYYVFGTDIHQMSDEWLAFYQSICLRKETYFEPIATSDEMLVRAKKKHQHITQLIAGPKNDSWVYVSQDRGCYYVYLYDPKSKRHELLVKGGIRNDIQLADENYPLVSWSDQENEIAIIYEKRDVLYLWTKNLVSKKVQLQELRPEIQRVYDMDHAKKGQLLLTVNTQGFSDMIFYKIKTREIIPINEDFYDDLNATYVSTSKNKGILFSSNRTDTIFKRRTKIDSILPLENMDIYYLDLRSEPNRLYQLTNTPDFNEYLPRYDGKGYVYFIRDILNTKNIQRIPFDPHKSIFPKSEWITNDRANITLYDLTADNNLLLQTTRDKHSFMFVKKPEDFTHKNLDITHRDLKEQTSDHEDQIQKDTASISYDELSFFQSEYELPSNFALGDKENSPSLDELIQMTSKNGSRKAPKIIEFNSAKAYAYRRKFSLYDISTTYDNSLLVDGLVAYDDANAGYTRPPGGILLNVQLKELFQDYDLIGGLRLSTNFNRAEYYIRFLNNKKLLDKEWVLYRYSNKSSQTALNLETHFFRSRTLIAQYKVKYPFDIYRSISAQLSFRQEKKYWLVTDFQSLTQPDIDAQRLGLKLAYVFDNTLYLANNMLRGTRYKITVEAIKKFSIDTDPWTFKLNKGFMIVTDLDFRNYIKLSKYAIFATRVAAATSFGSEKILYYIGGSDNWLFSQFNYDIPRPDPLTYAYQTAAPNLRGFVYNARNGQSYALINAELRVAPVNYLLNDNVKMSFLKNLQVIGFFDMGMAWYGLGPRSRQNLINNKRVENGSVVANVLFYKEPLIASYGWGLRSMIFGYYLRFDYGYGIDSQLKQKPLAHISLGLDF